MPTAPELGDVTAEIGGREITRQFDSEQFTSTYGYIRITREISVDLEREKDSRRYQLDSGLACSEEFSFITAADSIFYRCIQLPV